MDAFGHAGHVTEGTSGALTARSWGITSRIVFCVAASILWLAAILKAYDLSTRPVAGEGLLSSRPLAIVIVELELLLGTWLFLGLAPRLAWFTATCVFSTFAVASLWQGLSGKESCGCFGRLETSPWLILGLDLVVLVALVAFRPRATPSQGGRWRVALLAIVMLFAGVPMGYAMSRYQPTLIASDGVILGSGTLVVLEPEKWVGTDFPLLPHIDLGQSLKQGDWEVWLYRHDCSECSERLERLEFRHSSTRLVLIEVPPHVHDAQRFAAVDVEYGRLTSDYDWFVETPVELILRDGRVEHVEKGGEH